MNQRERELHDELDACLRDDLAHEQEQHDARMEQLDPAIFYDWDMSFWAADQEEFDECNAAQTAVDFGNSTD